MDLQKMIADLQAERDRLDAAILTLERLSASNTGRPGRPPRWLKNAAGNPTRKVGGAPKDNDASRE